MVKISPLTMIKFLLNPLLSYLMQSSTRTTISVQSNPNWMENADVSNNTVNFSVIHLMTWQIHAYIIN